MIPMPTQHSFINLTGEVFGSLTVLEFAGQDRFRGSLWLCRCECGGETVCRGGDLKRGATRSCGCLHKSIVVATQTTHGLSHLPEYKVWWLMLQRCEDTSRNDYARYGGRGINVCERWHTFENFIADMGRRPSPKHQIDRIDNSIGYSPENCRWVTASQNCRNRRNNRIVTFRGEKRCLAECIELSGLNYGTVYSRLRLGWTVEEALAKTPQRGKGGPSCRT